MNRKEWKWILGGMSGNGYSGLDFKCGISSLEFPPVKLTFVKGRSMMKVPNSRFSVYM